MMRTNGFLLLPFLLLISSLIMVGTGFCDSICGHVNLDWISTQISLPANAKVLQVQEKEGLCELCGNARFYALFYLIPLRLPFP
jgi:hypothetical protein